MMAKTFFNTCPHCGANLDPGETCDCQREASEECALSRMKSFMYKPVVDVDEMLYIYHMVPDSCFSFDDGFELIQRWERESLGKLSPRDERYRNYYLRGFGAMFLLDCGRIYGIREERARRRASKR